MSKSTKEHEKNRKKKGFRFALSEETNRLIDNLALRANCTRSEVITDAINVLFIQANTVNYKDLSSTVELKAEDLKLDEKQTDIFNKVKEIIIPANNVNKPGK